MADLQSFAALLGKGTEEAAAKGPEPKKGYDGKVLRLSVQLETKGRGGKTVTLVRGFQSHPKELHDLTQLLKKKCGTGGSVGDNCIELQGDQRQTAEKFLRERGYEFKSSTKK